MKINHQEWLSLCSILINGTCVGEELICFYLLQLDNDLARDYADTRPLIALCSSPAELFPFVYVGFSTGNTAVCSTTEQEKCFYREHEEKVVLKGTLRNLASHHL